MEIKFYLICCIGAFKNFGEKTAALFDRKKKDASNLAAEKVAEASHMVEDQAKKVGDTIQSTKSDAEKAALDAASSGNESIE